MDRRCQLSQRAAFEALPARDADGGRFTDLVRASVASRDAWRIVELDSPDAAPFEARLSWTSGDAAERQVEVDVSRSTRLCLFARSLSVRARNHTNQSARLLVSIADGHTATENHRVVRGSGLGQALAVDIPAFARRVRFDHVTPSSYATSTFDLLDPDGDPIARHTLKDQPPLGVALAGVAGLQVTTEGAFRAVFTLHL